MKSLIASLAVFVAVPMANAALVITEFGLGPDGQEFVVIANTASGPPVDLSNISISVNNGATINPVGLTNTMQAGDTAILARQTLGSFAATYGFPPATVDYFATISGLDFVGSGASGIILYDEGNPFYSVGYGGGGYGGDLCIVINPPGGGTPTTAENTTAFSTVPEPGSAMLAALAAIGLAARRRRHDG
jgi:MYXO-CTERM domain-containing protein